MVVPAPVLQAPICIGEKNQSSQFEVLYILYSVKRPSTEPVGVGHC